MIQDEDIPPSPQTTNFRLVQIETNCRQHFKVHLKRKISTIQGKKHCEKRRNCLLQAISPFLTMFSTAVSLVRQNAVLCCNGLIEKTRFQ